MLDRRSFVLTSLALAATPASAADNPFAALEAQHGGRLGVASLDTATGNRMSWRANERFPMCSTFKLLAVSAVLSKADHGQEHLDRFVRYGQPDLLEYAPVTRRNVARHGMSLDGLCEAAISYSDNTAANLLLKSLGGPEAGTHFCRAISDPVTRIDRFEPDANTCLPNDPRDTTTPQAMLADVYALLLGKVLAAPSRQRLLTWLLNYQTRFPPHCRGPPRGMAQRT